MFFKPWDSSANVISLMIECWIFHTNIIYFCFVFEKKRDYVLIVPLFDYVLVNLEIFIEFTF